MPTRRLRTLFAVVTVVLSLGLATGCGGEPDATSAATPTATLTGPGTNRSENFNTGDAFIQALAENTAEQFAAARSLVAPKSSAARYLTKAQDEVASGAATPRTVSEISEGSYRLCAGDDCSTVSDLVLSDGKISSFKVDGKQIR